MNGGHPDESMSGPRGSGSPSRRRRRLVVVVAVLAVGVVVAGFFGVRELGREWGFWGQSDSLQVLLDDPLASKNLLNLQLVHSRLPDRGPLTKSQRPKVEHWFSPGQRKPQAVKTDVADFGQAHGWHYPPDISDRASWIAYRSDQDGNTLVAMVQVVEKHDGVPDIDLTGTVKVTIFCG